MKLKHYLIASPENNYRPWVLSKTAMACFCLAIWALRMFVPGYIAIGAPGIDSQDLMTRVNNERTSRFLPALITNSQLNAAAGIKSSDMIERSYFAHVNPDGDYVWPVIEAQGYKPYQSLGENLAMDFSSAESAVNAWMNSPGHRANILNENFVDQGMAAVYGEFETGHFTYLITNLFGKLFEPQKQTVASSQSQKPESTSPAPTTNTDQNTSQTPVATTDSSTKITDTPTNTQTPAETTDISTNSNSLTTDANKHNPGNTIVASDSSDLMTLKIVVGLFAAFYFFFLIIDSIIIHQAKIRRENIGSSPHALLMLFIVLVNYLTLWL